MNNPKKTTRLPSEDRKFIQQKLKKRSLILVGMMGCGKSTIGREIAKLLGKTFYDSDREIELKTGLSISQIFEDYGEDTFRSLEREIFTHLLSKKNIIIASGGGAFIQEDIRERILAKHLALWLRADVNLLYQRVRLRQHRPLLKQQEPKKILYQLTKTRTPYYRQAQIRIFASAMPKKALARKAVEQLQEYLKQEILPEHKDKINV